MSRVRARMAKTGILSFINRSGFYAGFGVAFSCGALHAQENVFRSASVRLPAVTIAPQKAAPIGSNQTIDGSIASKTSEVAIQLSPEQSSVTGSEVLQSGEAKQTTAFDGNYGKDQSDSKNREPLKLPALTVPNTSVSGAEQRETPEDFVVGRLPAVIPLPYGADRYGFWEFGNKTWVAPVYCVQPFYFEDTMLERHGHERFPKLQPFVSGARFFGDIAFLPYHAYLQRPLEERPSTGHYRAGSSAPCIRQRAPYDAGALRFQLLTTGTAVLAVQP